MKFYILQRVIMENMENIYFKLVTIISVENERSVSV